MSTTSIVIATIILVLYGIMIHALLLGLIKEMNNLKKGIKCMHASTTSMCLDLNAVRYAKALPYAYNDRPIDNKLLVEYLRWNYKEETNKGFTPQLPFLAIFTPDNDVFNLLEEDRDAYENTRKYFVIYYKKLKNGSTVPASSKVYSYGNDMTHLDKLMRELKTVTYKFEGNSLIINGVTTYVEPPKIEVENLLFHNWKRTWSSFIIGLIETYNMFKSSGGTEECIEIDKDFSNYFIFFKDVEEFKISEAIDPTNPNKEEVMELKNEFDKYLRKKFSSES